MSGGPTGGGATPEDRLAGFVAGLTLEQIPGPARHTIGTLCLDTAACMLAALPSPICTRVRDAMVREAGGGASLVGSETRVAAGQAALHNGLLAHWSEWDDVFDPGAVHGSAVIFPALLAIAETRGRPDGRKFVTAAVAAFEVACRIGRLLWRTAHPGWMPTGIAGAIGAAAGAARLAGLDPTGVRNAMGLAAAIAGASRQPILERVSAKNSMAGLAALKALTALDLVIAGVEAPRRFLTGDHGLVALMAPAADPDIAAAGLAERFDVTAISLKPWPSCRSTHGGIEMALDLHAEGVRAASIDQVSVALSSVMLELVGAPFALGDEPRVAAQFSLAYTTALAFVHGRVGIDHFDAARIRSDRATLDLARRITSHQRTAPDGDPFAQSMQVRLRDGRVLERSLTDLKGMPTRPLGAADLQAKLADAAAGVLSEPDREALAQAALALEDQGVAQLMAILRRAGQVG